MSAWAQRLGAPGRFLVSGALNATATFVLYLALLTFIDYRVAYSVAFVAGICLAYVLNRSFVFRTGGGVSAMVLLAMVYVAQYLVGVAIVTLWVEAIGLPPALAPLAAIAITIPLTYVLSRWVFVGRPEARRERTDASR